MRIQDVLKANRAIYRKGSRTVKVFSEDVLRGKILLSYDDLMAEDWEVEDPAVFITRSDLICATWEIFQELNSGRRGRDTEVAPNVVEEVINKLVQKLGFANGTRRQLTDME